MKQMRKRLGTLLISFVLLGSLCLPAMAISENELTSAVTQSAKTMLHAVKTPQVGSIGGEWAVIGLARSGYAVPQEYWDGYYAAVEDYVSACKGVLHKKKYTEYSRVTVALTAIGADPTKVAGYNLLMPLGDFEKTVWQGINGPIWALIAFDSGNYPIPEGGDVTREALIQVILDAQLPDGGWALSGSTSDPDMTGMALQALAPYYNTDADVKKAVDTALIYLSDAQQADGSFNSIDGKNKNRDKPTSFNHNKSF
jgi:hypothetical protein